MLMVLACTMALAAAPSDSPVSVQYELLLEAALVDDLQPVLLARTTPSFERPSAVAVVVDADGRRLLVSRRLRRHLWGRLTRPYPTQSEIAVFDEIVVDTCVAPLPDRAFKAVRALWRRAMPPASPRDVGFDLGARDGTRTEIAVDGRSSRNFHSPHEDTTEGHVVAVVDALAVFACAADLDIDADTAVTRLLAVVHEVPAFR